jgi:hypothetical protein
VLLEVAVLHDQGTLQQLRLNRSADPAFHANLDRIDAWFKGPSPTAWSSRRAYLVSEIKSMMARDPEVRPTAKELLIRVTGYDVAHMIKAKHSLFGDCCRGNFMSSKEREREKLGYTNTINHIRSDLQRAYENLTEKNQQGTRVIEEYRVISARLRVAQAGFKIGSNKGNANTSQELTKTLETENDKLTLRLLVSHQTRSDKSNKPDLSTMQRSEDNPTDTQMSTSDWQLEKKRLEQRIAELEASGGMSMPPPRPPSAVVVVPQGIPESRRKPAPLPFFRRAAGPKKKKKEPSNLEYGETQEEKGRTPRRDDYKDIMGRLLESNNEMVQVSDSSSRWRHSSSPEIPSFSMSREERESKQRSVTREGKQGREIRREEREREQGREERRGRRGEEERYVYRSQANEDSHELAHGLNTLYRRGQPLSRTRVIYGEGPIQLYLLSPRTSIPPPHSPDQQSLLQPSAPAPSPHPQSAPSSAP